MSKFLFSHLLPAFAFIILFDIAFCDFAPAQGINFSSIGSGPIEITAEDGLELHQKERKMYANKNVVIKRDGDTLSADKVSADYREGKEGNNELWKINAYGDVIMTSDNSVATGEEAEYLLDNSMLTVKGKPATLDTNNEKIQALTLEYDQKNKLFTAKNNAKIVRNNGQVEAEQISASFIEDKDNKLEIDTLSAAGEVVITTENERITGNKVEYSPKTGEAILTGNVKLTKDGNYLQGDKATVNFNTGVSRLYADGNSENVKKSKNNSRVRGVFLPDSIKDSKKE